MAPILVGQIAQSARRAILTAGPHIAARYIQQRSLSVNSTQKVTLGIIALYVVVIALLWNIPYVRWSLWPFKVSSPSQQRRKKAKIRFFADACYRFPRIWSCNHSLLHWRTRKVYLARPS